MLNNESGDEVKDHLIKEVKPQFEDAPVQRLLSFSKPNTCTYFSLMNI